MEIKTLNREEVLKNFIKHKDMVDKRNEEGIEKYRKGDFTIKFNGKNNKKVTIKQTKHKFLFGTTGFMFGSFEDDKKEVIYKEKFVNLFNQAVVPFYWKDLEPEEGKLRFRKDSEFIYRRPAPDTVLEFCNEYGIEPKGHCLVWNSHIPKWLAKYTPEERKVILERRVKQIAEEYADKIPSWDVVNESASFYLAGKADMFEGYDEFGVQLGGKYLPNNIKILNDTNNAIWERYCYHGKYMPFNMQLKDFLQKGYPIDEIGIQYHAFLRAETITEDKAQREYLDIKNIVEILDIFNSYNLPMHISEITVPSFFGGCKGNEEIQAEIVETLYKTWFATKNMKSIVWWNLVDGYAAYAPLGSCEGENYFGGGLLHFDMTEKPAYRVLDRLINHEWKTNIESVVQNDTLSFRGFYGEYEVVVDGKAFIVNFDESGKEVIL
jgi:GH35 family endo-1,4-beta-xylanase